MTVKPVVTTRPVNKYVMSGQKAVFTVKASGAGLSYQWQTCSDGKSWVNSNMPGNRTAALTVEATTSRNGYRYCCVVKDINGNKITSKEALMTVFGIVTQPQGKYAVSGMNAVFSVKVTGQNLRYQWQACTNGTIWVNSGMKGNKTASLTVPVMVTRNGYKYRCVVTDGNGGKIITNVAGISVFGIAVQPVNKSVSAGSKAEFTVNATGQGLSFMWMVSTDGGKTWKETNMSGDYSNRLVVPVVKSRNGYRYRCLIIDRNGRILTSNTAVLTVK